MADQDFTPKPIENLCPVCLKRIHAHKVAEGNEILMVKHCQDHGTFEAVAWRGEPPMGSWQRPKVPVHPTICYSDVDLGCPFDCGICEQHEQLPCSALLEVTQRCNLRCPVCFADSGSESVADPNLETIAFWFNRVKEAAGACNIQLSGGEPTLRDDLPAIIEIGRKTGFSFIQLNTNGLHLSSCKDYVRTLKDAGLVSVFLQFDGVDDGIYQSLRGRPLLAEKLQAIERCDEGGLGVVLVPTLVPGVNTRAIGSIVKLALKLGPVVRGVHFQPMSYFGRYPAEPERGGRITLPEVMKALEEQTEGMIKKNQFSPPGCEHALCSFHGTFIRTADGGLKSITENTDRSCCSQATSAGVSKTVALVSQRWTAPAIQNDFPMTQNRSCCNPRLELSSAGPVDLDTFLEQVRSNSFTISCMAFQDVWTLDLERLRGCCIFVVARDGCLVPFCAYNLTSTTGQRLYRNEEKD